MKHHENILTALLAAALSVSCSSNEQDTVIERTVTATYARTESTQSERNYTFISTPFRSSELSFRVSGPVTEFDVQNGQFFRKGELIAAIDDRDSSSGNREPKPYAGRLKRNISEPENVHERQCLPCKL